MQPQKIEKSYIIKAKDYINKQETKLQLENYLCGVCYDISIRPVLCEGPCHKPFCIKCFSMWKSQKDQCPYMCSPGPFTMKRLEKQLDIDFICPFDQEKCKKEIKNINQFEQHLKECQYVTQQVKQEIYQRQNYLCKKGHRLQFFNSVGEQIRNIQCKMCQETGYSRTICRKCDQKYCVKCRIPQVCKKNCFLRHQFIKLLGVNNENCVCDECGLTLTQEKQYSYYERQCNLLICQKCFILLPDEIAKAQETNFQNYNNPPNQCSQKHQLEIDQNFQEKFKNGNLDTKCNLCEKIKPCLKNCKNCGQSYCLKCKPLKVSRLSKCLYGHKIFPYKPNENENNAEQICYSCLKPKATYKDKKCNFKLCMICFYHFMDLCCYVYDKFSDLTKKKQYQCIKKHPLCFLSSSQRIKLQLRKCIKCNTLKPMTLDCFLCKNYPNYCADCVPPNPSVCYFDHPLQEFNQKVLQQCLEQDSDFQYLKRLIYSCQLCETRFVTTKIQNNQYQDNFLYYCKFCNFFICKLCEDKLIQNKTEKNKQEQQSMVINQMNELNINE